MLRYPFDPGPRTRTPDSSRRDWVFLYEASGNRDPLLARAQIDVIRGLLENAEHDDTFSILVANTRVRFFDAKPQAATAENIKDAIKFLEGVHLIGASISARRSAPSTTDSRRAKNPHLVHVGSGITTIGQRSDAALAQVVSQRDQVCRRRCRQAMGPILHEAGRGAHRRLLHADQPRRSDQSGGRLSYWRR